MISGTLLEVRDLAGGLKGTFPFSGAASPRTLTYAQVVAALGAVVSFQLRAFFQRGGHRSLHYDSVIVSPL